MLDSFILNILRTDIINFFCWKTKKEFTKQLKQFRLFDVFEEINQPQHTKKKRKEKQKELKE